MKLVGFVLMLLSIASFLAPLVGFEIPEVDDLPAVAKYAGSLAGGMLFGFARARQRIAREPDAAPPAGMPAGLVCANTGCGQSVNPDHSFCTACGTAIEVPAPESAGCTNPACDAQITGDRPFCTSCGWPVAEQPVSATPEETALRCPNGQCAEVVQPGQKFCTACGASLN